MIIEPVNQVKMIGQVDAIIGGNDQSRLSDVGTVKVNENSGTRASVPSDMSASNKLVPLDQRLATLSDKFDDKTLKQMGAVECATCASRTYQDGSNDPGVSFKSPTHINPAQAATAVMSHEMEHVSHEQSNAEAEDRQVISQSVQIFRNVCPECGKSYVSGGVTKTSTAAKAQNAYQMQKETSPEGNLVDVTL